MPPFGSPWRGAKPGRRGPVCWYRGVDDTKRRVLRIAYDDVRILDIACPSGALDIVTPSRR